MNEKRAELTKEQQDIREELIDNGIEEAVIDVYAELVGEEYIENIEEAYQGQYSNDEEFAQQTAEDLGLLENDNQWPAYCIDWEWAARELMMDYMEENGYYFRSL